MKTKLSLLVFHGFILLCLLSAPALGQRVLTLEGECPGPMRAEVNGARPGAIARLYYSPRRGSYSFPPFHPCHGVTIGLDPHGIRYIGSSRADQDGMAVFNGMVGSQACGAFLQAMVGFCEVTNVVQIR